MKLLLFFSYLYEYGLPSHIRTDKGGENINVALFFLMHPLCGPGLGTVLLEQVHTTNVSKDCGGRYMMGWLVFIMSCFIIQKLC